MAMAMAMASVHRAAGSSACSAPTHGRVCWRQRWAPGDSAPAADRHDRPCWARWTARVAVWRPRGQQVPRCPGQTARPATARLRGQTTGRQRVRRSKGRLALLCEKMAQAPASPSRLATGPARPRAGPIVWRLALRMVQRRARGRSTARGRPWGWPRLAPRHQTDRQNHRTRLRIDPRTQPPGHCSLQAGKCRSGSGHPA